MVSIPQFSEVLVPKKDLNILDLLDYTLPPTDHSLNLQFIPPTNLLSKLPSSMVNTEQILLLRTLPMPNKEDLAALRCVFLEPYQSSSIQITTTTFQEWV